jgi:formylglycine-generating enzyme required for sulfatase activity
MEIRCIGDYDLVSPISLEGHCHTFLGEHRFLKKEVVIKVIETASLSTYEYLKETFGSLEHPHLIKPLVIEYDDEKILLVYDPFFDHKKQSLNLQDFLSQHEQLSEEMVLSIVTQIGSALDYLKNEKIFYSNIKLTNCLVQNVLKDDIFVGLVDFILHPEQRIEEIPIIQFERTMKYWMNRSLESKEDLLAKHQLSNSFLAPEITNSSSDLFALNVYAFGVLTYYLLTKTIPQPQILMPSKIRNYQYNWDALVQACLQIQPQDRPKTIKQAIELIHKKPVEVIKKEVKVQEIVSEIQKSPSIKPLESASLELKPALKAQELIRPTFDPDPAQIFHTESIIAPYRPKEKEHLEVLPIQTDMIIIPEGEYIRGSNEGARDERPAHRVFLSSFAMDIHPVTNEQFVRFLEVMGGEKDSQNNDLIRLRESRIKRSAGKLIIESGYAKHPVVGVSWYGAVGYAKWVGKRLPTEAEWEVASRSLKPDLIYPTGLNIERTHANFFSADTTPVMSYPPIDIGLYDMAGNVYEWCHDWYDYNFYESSLQEPTNPKGPAQGVYRVLRGGCWKSLKDDLRCSHRHRNNPGTVNKTYGFRCAADVEAV